MSFSPEGWIYLIILTFVTVGAVLRSVNLLIIMSGMMFAPLLLNWRIGSHIIRMATTRRIVPNRIHVGSPVYFQWMFTNQSRVPVWHLSIQDEVVCIQSTQEPLGKKGRPKVSKTQVVFNYVSVGNDEYASFRSLFLERGIYEVGPAVVASRAPFGLVKTWMRLNQKHQFHVAPRLGHLQADWERRIASHVAGQESMQRQRGSDEDEFYALRPWRSGDSKRQIHWRTTAKFRQPMVKQFDQRTNRDLAVALDLFQSESSAVSFEPQHLQRIESLVSFGASVMASLGNDVQGQVGMAIAGSEFFVDCQRNHSEYVSRIMRELAIARGGRSPDIVAGINELMGRVSVGTPIFVFSTRPCPTEWLEQKFDAARWQQVRTWMRWIDVESIEFKELFEFPEPAESDVKVIDSLQREANIAST